MEWIQFSSNETRFLVRDQEIWFQSKIYWPFSNTFSDEILQRCPLLPNSCAHVFLKELCVLRVVIKHLWKPTVSQFFRGDIHCRKIFRHHALAQNFQRNCSAITKLFSSKFPNGVSWRQTLPQSCVSMRIYSTQHTLKLNLPHRTQHKAIWYEKLWKHARQK